MILATQLHRVVQMLESKHMEVLREHGVTSRQVAVLEAVAASKELPSQTTLVNATGIDRSTLADVVRRLVKKGMIQRRRTKNDARAYELQLTAEGKAMLKTTLKAMKTVEAKGAGVPNIAGLAAAVQACLADTVAVAAE